MMALYRSQMVAYARGQRAAAQLVLAAHVPDGADCCAACGRPSPCRARAEAAQLHARYAAWLAETAEPLATEHGIPLSGRMVRPYVINHESPDLEVADRLNPHRNHSPTRTDCSKARPPAAPDPSTPPPAP